MNSLIPFSFVQKKTSLSWSEALWAYEKGIIDQTHILKLALEKLSLDSDDREFELSSLDENNTSRIEQLLGELATSGVQNPLSFTINKWLFLKLAWVYENKNEVADPLEEVEMIYADFDYPSELESFVRYMPAVDGYQPSQHSYEENINRIFENWRRYLELESNRFSEK